MTHFEESVESGTWTDVTLGETKVENKCLIENSRTDNLCYHKV